MKTRKIIGPVVITLIVCLYDLFWIATYFNEDIPTIFKVVMVTVSLGVVGVSLYVLIERIREIYKGEEDDLSKY